MRILASVIGIALGSAHAASPAHLSVLVPTAQAHQPSELKQAARAQKKKKALSDTMKAAAPSALESRWRVSVISPTRAILLSTQQNGSPQSLLVSHNESVEIEGYRLQAQIRNETLSLFYTSGNKEQTEVFHGGPNTRPSTYSSLDSSIIKTNEGSLRGYGNNQSESSTKSELPAASLCLTSAGSLLAGCQATAATAPTGVHVPVLQQTVEEKIKGAVESGQKPSLIFRGGEPLATVLRSLGMMDGKTYILDGESQTLPGPSAKIYNVHGLESYFKAYGKSLELITVENSPYVRVKIKQEEPASKQLANKDCNVKMFGTVPVGQTASDIAAHAQLHLTYADTGSTGYASVVYPVSYQGPCANALEYLGKKSDLTVNFNDSGVEFRMMDSATIDIGIPLQNRKIAMDILADGKSGGGGSTPSASGTGTSSAPTASGGGGSKSAQTSYVTDYAASIKSMLDSTKSPFGSWNYVPETGHIFIRDRADAVAAAKANVNRMAQSFQSRFEVTLTLYRMTVSKDKQINGSLAGVINNALSINFGLANVLQRSTASVSVLGEKSAFQVLSEWGAIETLDSFSMTLQAGIPQTLKVANNTEYVRNISSTTAGTTGAVTSTIEQANATDGSFVTIHARQTEAGKIAVDYGAFINRVDGFDTTQTSTSVVKSQRGFERTFDTLAVVDDGIPYVASVVSQKLRNDKNASLPGLEDAKGFVGFLSPLVAGSKSDLSSQTYIVVMVEARRQ